MLVHRSKLNEQDTYHWVEVEGNNQRQNFKVDTENHDTIGNVTYSIAIWALI